MAINIKKTEAPKTLKEAGMRALQNTLRIAGGLLVGYILVHWLTGGLDEITQPYPSAPIMEERAPVKDSPAFVWEKHKDDCWRGSDQPKAELPGAAIVQFNSGKTVYTTKHVLVDEAFNEALANVGYGDKTSDRLEVIALCK